MKKNIEFSGFQETCFNFLTVLKENNNKEWFNKYQNDYRNCVIKPSKQFVLALGEKLHLISEGIKCDPRANGLGSILRIYKGVITEKTKEPYYSELRLYFWEGNNNKKFQNPGFFFRFKPDGGELFAGIYKFGKVILNAYYNALSDDELGPEIADKITQLLDMDDYTIENEHIKKVPITPDEDHPRKDLFTYNGMWIKAPALSIQDLYKKELVDICYHHCEIMSPIHNWLVKLSGSIAALIYKYR